MKKFHFVHKRIEELGKLTDPFVLLADPSLSSFSSFERVSVSSRSSSLSSKNEDDNQNN